MIAFWWNCALWIDNSTGLWLTCFVIISLCTCIISFCAAVFELLATISFKKSYMQFCAWKISAGLWLSLFFGDLNMEFFCLRSLSSVFNWLHCCKMVPFELMITCTGLWLTCFVILFLYALLKFSAAAFEWLAFIAFKKCYVQFCASRKTSAGLWLSHCFFVDSNNDIFPLLFLSSLLKSILIVMKLCFLIDDNMHWALIDLFLWYYFCIHDYSFTRGCFFVACYYCFQSYMQFCASGKRSALTESLFLET